MKAPLEIKNHFKEHNLYVNRVTVVMIMAVVLFVVLLTRLAYLQIVHHQQYDKLSRNNTLRLEALTPNRGFIYDRHGEILAENVTTHYLEIIPEQTDNMEALLKDIGQLVELKPFHIKEFKKRIKSYAKFSSVPLRLKLNEKEASILSVNLHRLKGAHLKAGLIRHYPQGNLVSHVIGYVGRLNDDELVTIEKKRYRGTHFIGKSGIEKQYENSLHGYPGWQEIETNVFGRKVRKLNKSVSKPGHHLTLTLDMKLQRAAIEAMQGFKGALVALDPNNGEILALVSMPLYDPNAFINGAQQEISQVLEAADKPLFNRFLHGQYPPASTLKPLIGLAGLHYKVIDSKTQIDDPGWYKLNDKSRILKDWQPFGHGKTNLNKAIRESCDTFYYDLAFHLGINRISKWLTLFGFGAKTDIDLPQESQGLVPTRAWKKESFHEPWYTGETLITGIGQGYLAATPLQLAQSVALIASRGIMPKMHLVKGKILEANKASIIELDKTYWDDVIKGMHEVVNNPRGTAYKYFKGIDYAVAGKTGTAQVFGLQESGTKQSDLPAHLRDHSLFIGFAPIEHPQIAVAVVLENNSGSAVIAKKVFDSALKRPHS